MNRQCTEAYFPDDEYYEEIAAGAKSYENDNEMEEEID